MATTTATDTTARMTTVDPDGQYLALMLQVPGRRAPLTIGFVTAHSIQIHRVAHSYDHGDYRVSAEDLAWARALADDTARQIDAADGDPQVLYALTSHTITTGPTGREQFVEIGPVPTV